MHFSCKISGTAPRNLRSHADHFCLHIKWYERAVNSRWRMKKRWTGNEWTVLHTGRVWSTCAHCCWLVCIDWEWVESISMMPQLLNSTHSPCIQISIHGRPFCLAVDPFQSVVWSTDFLLSPSLLISVRILSFYWRLGCDMHLVLLRTSMKRQVLKCCVFPNFAWFIKSSWHYADFTIKIPVMMSWVVLKKMVKRQDHVGLLCVSVIPFAPLILYLLEDSYGSKYLFGYCPSAVSLLASSVCISWIVVSVSLWFCYCWYRFPLLWILWWQVREIAHNLSLYNDLRFQAEALMALQEVGSFSAVQGVEQQTIGKMPVTLWYALLRWH